MSEKFAKSIFRMAAMSQVAYKLSDFFTVERRRAEFAQLGAAEPSQRAFDDLCALWQRYLDHGRDQLLGLGTNERVIVSPEIVPSFAIADMVVGSTLVDIKVSTNHQTMMLAWLDQVLGYVLLDRRNHLHVDCVGLYCARHGRVVSVTVDEAISQSRHGHTIKPAALRDGLREALRADLDAAEADNASRCLQP